MKLMEKNVGEVKKKNKYIFVYMAADMNIHVHYVNYVFSGNAIELIIVLFWTYMNLW